MKKYVLATMLLLICTVICCGCSRKVRQSNESKPEGKNDNNLLYQHVKPKHNLPQPVEPGLIHGSAFGDHDKKDAQESIEKEQCLSFGDIKIDSIGTDSNTLLKKYEALETDDLSFFALDDGLWIQCKLSDDAGDNLAVVDDLLYYSLLESKGTIKAINKYTGRQVHEYFFGDFEIDEMFVLTETDYLCLCDGDLYLATTTDMSIKRLTDVGTINRVLPTPYGVLYSYDKEELREVLFFNGYLIGENIQGWHLDIDTLSVNNGNDECNINLKAFDEKGYPSSLNYNLSETDSTCSFGQLIKIIDGEERWIGVGTDTEIVYHHLTKCLKNKNYEYMTNESGVYKKGVLTVDKAENLNVSGNYLYYTEVADREVVKAVNIYTGKVIYQNRFKGFDINQMYLINNEDLLFLSDGALYLVNLKENIPRQIWTEQRVDCYIPSKWGIIYSVDSGNTNGSYTEHDLFIDGQLISKQVWEFEVNDKTLKCHKITDEIYDLSKLKKQQ
ncbi:MAG: hypothetical protein J6Z02_06540 [Lachnospiraceae bacterium]|nr:hypothetical protein [Lachnospiraceae bacterium]